MVIGSLKILVPLYLTYIVFLFSVFFIFIPQQKKQLMDQKKETIRQLTNSALSLLSELENKAAQGYISPEQARASAISQIRNMRYGVEGKDYFWINDMHPFMIMHPYRPDLDGTDLSSFKDPAGNYPFVAMVETVKYHRDGFVNYFWKWENIPQKMGAKISYVKGFPSWGWVLGTGLYVDDIQHEMELIVQNFLRMFVGILVFITCLSIYITKRVLRAEYKRAQAEAAKNLDELRLKKLLELSQMTRNSIHDLTEFALEEAIQLTCSEIGYLAFLNEEESQLTMHTWSRQTMKACEIEDKILIYNVEDTGLWAEAARSRKTIVINDYQNFESSRKMGYPQGHVHISRVINVPIFDGEKIVALVGVGNKKEDYNDSDVRQLRLMMDGMWKILQQKKSQDDLRRSEERIRESNADLRLAQQISGIGSWAFNAETGVRTWSDELFRILERDPELGPFTLNDFKEIYVDKWWDIYYSGFQAAVKEGSPYNVELRSILPSGNVKWVNAICEPQPERGPNGYSLRGTIQDITERKNLESRLRQVQKMEALGTLAGGIAHDFNNILSSMIGFAELAKLGLEGDHERTDCLDQVLSAGVRARNLVKHILTFSRRADAKKDIIPILPLLKECLNFLRASVLPNIEINHHFTEEKITVLSDPTQLHQIFMNLLTNAAYAMKKNGGRLEVKLDSVDILQDDIHQFKELSPGNYAQIIISDTGCGIPKHLIGKIFEPFFTTKPRGEGTGMGLSTVYGIIREMKGDITVYSEEGIGSTFRILMPEQSRQVQDGTVQEPVRLIKGKGKILIVDDEVSIIKWMSRILMQLGYDVVVSYNGSDALKILASSPSGFDLVLTDLAMPGMTGLELSEKIKARQPDIPIILCTGFSEGLTSGTIQRYGISKMVMKPLIASELAEMISNVLVQKENRTE